MQSPRYQMHECLQRKLGCLLCAICQSFHRCWIWSAIFPVCDLAIKELLPALHSSSKVQWLAHINPIPLVLQKILARIMLSEIKTSRLFIYFCYLHVMSLPWKLVVVPSRWLVKFFFLNSNDVLDAILSADLGEQRCFKFLTRQLVSLNKTNSK